MAADHPPMAADDPPMAADDPPMAADDAVTYRTAVPADAGAIASLHADSWRRHYRGAYSDAFLDGDVATERLAVWTDRMNEPGEGRSTIVAESDGVVVGFCHAVFDHDPRWGTLVDNLHVTYRLKAGSIGTRLLARTAEVVVGRRPRTGLYLWVLEQNTAAQAFYEARGGVRVEHGWAGTPGGDPRLNGNPGRFRYAWSDPSVLI
jgi:ribosomal protein S18 acetylase RimI-like enzyme